MPTVVFGTAVVGGALPGALAGCGSTGSTGSGSGGDAATEGGQQPSGSDAVMDAGGDAAESGFCGCTPPVEAGAEGGADSGADGRVGPIPLAYMGFDVRYFGSGD